MNFTIKEFTKIKKNAQNYAEGTSFYNFEHNILLLEKKYFQKLEIFVKNLLKEDKKNSKIFELGYQYGNHTIEIKNYVGVLGIANDFLIEILPKTYNPNVENFDAKNSRKLALKMMNFLQKLGKKTPFFMLDDVSTQLEDKKINDKKANEENLTENNYFLEFFIDLFLEELKILLQKGLKYGYEIREENLNYLKGNLVFHKHLQHNLLQKNHFFVEFDEFTQDIFPNQYIKSTLFLLQNISQNPKNITKIQQYLQYFGHIQLLDFSQIDTKNIRENQNHNKNFVFFNYYEKTLKFCDFFVQKTQINHFLSDKNADFGISILWNMEQIFEQYVGEIFKKFFKKIENKTLKIQEKKHFLIENSSKNEKNIDKKLFALRPDIVLYENIFEIDDFVEKPIKIWDTKWKLLDKSKENFGISQADVYQMYVYAKKYNINEITLLYPQQADFLEDFWINFEDNVRLYISFFSEDYFEKNNFLKI